MFANISIMSQILTPNDLFEKLNMTVHVVEKNDVGNCTKDVFTGVPQDSGEIGLTIKAYCSFQLCEKQQHENRVMTVSSSSYCSSLWSPN